MYVLKKPIRVSQVYSSEDWFSACEKKIQWVYKIQDSSLKREMLVRVIYIKSRITTYKKSCCTWFFIEHSEWWSIFELQSSNSSCCSSKKNRTISKSSSSKINKEINKVISFLSLSKTSLCQEQLRYHFMLG